jgi:hypothetical protein
MRRIGSALLIVAALGSVAPAAKARVAPPEADAAADPGIVVRWNQIAVAAAVTAKQFPAQSSISVSLAQAAVYDALVVIDSRYRAYGLRFTRTPSASRQAAVAVAAHDVLVRTFPNQTATLDTYEAASLASLPEGAAKQTGAAVGAAAAAGIARCVRATA